MKREKKTLSKISCSDKKEKREKPFSVKKIGKPKVSIIVLWVILIGSVSFGIYKNFTAIDIQTIHEKEIVEEKIVDTSGIESFVKEFAKIYHTWKNDSDSLNSRANDLAAYLPDNLQKVNAEMVRMDCPTRSDVNDIKIWKFEKKQVKNEYLVVYSVEQTVTESVMQTITEPDTAQELAEEEEPAEIATEVMSESSNVFTTAYETTVHVDETGNMLIVQNPTVCALPEKSDYVPDVKPSDGTVESETSNEITEFLQTFFSLYPTATEKELSYYVKGNVIDPIYNSAFVFDSLSNVTMFADDEKVKVSLYVKYLDQNTKTIQFSQYSLILEKGDNWMIVDVE